MEHIIRRISENLVYRNEFAVLYDDPVVFPDGSEGSYLRVVESDGAPGVAVLAVCADQVALVQTYRYPVSALEWAVPRGFAHGGDPAATARAELAEELGREPDSLISIGTVTPNSGILASRVELFLGRYATPASVPHDAREVAGIRWIALPDLADEIARGDIQDAFTLSAVTCALARKLIEFP